MRITGTFIDEITVDIMPNNWGQQEWAKDFRAMKHIGIDTVIIIRSGFQNNSIFSSKTLKKHIPTMMPVYEDLCEMFLRLSEENGISLYFGTYDDYHKLKNNGHQKIIEVNKEFVEEAWQKYSSFKAFKGWYITQELAVKDDASMRCIKEIADHCKLITNKKLPTLISPYIAGIKQFENPITLEQHEKDWDYMLSYLKDSIDIVAFQDGNVDFHELPDYIETNNKLLKKYGMRVWSNLETFDRDMPFKFPPLDWRKLRWKLDAAAQADVEKIITFTFSSFMSPYSCWAGAGNLYDRYCEYIGVKKLKRE
jgi:hypothetical protein